MSTPFTLTLGLDLRPQTTGAVQYALWMCECASLKPAGHVESVHVIEPEGMVELLRHADEQTILGAFKRRGKELLDEVGHGAGLHAPTVVGGDAVEQLEEHAREATALLLSRRARADKNLALARLGSVARRLLRRLKQPTIIAPPELLRSEIGDGPIVVAVDFSEGSVRALSFARVLSEVLARPLQLVYFAEVPDQIGYVGILQSERWNELIEEIIGRGREKMSAFVREHELGEVQTVVLRGPVLPALGDHAAQVRACLLVTGSGHHGLLHRVIVPSVASETAAMAAMAVAVVP